MADRGIAAGTLWEGTISAELERSAIILILVSPDFLASDYCYGIEMKRAVELYERGNAVVIPIILRECDWEGAPFEKIQGLPLDMKPVISRHWHTADEAFNNVAQGLKMSVKKIHEKIIKKELKISLSIQR